LSFNKPFHVLPAAEAQRLLKTSLIPLAPPSTTCTWPYGYPFSARAVASRLRLAAAAVRMTRAEILAAIDERRAAEPGSYRRQENGVKQWGVYVYVMCICTHLYLSTFRNPLCSCSSQCHDMRFTSVITAFPRYPTWSRCGVEGCCSPASNADGMRGGRAQSTAITNAGAGGAWRVRHGGAWAGWVGRVGLAPQNGSGLLPPPHSSTAWTMALAARFHARVVRKGKP
jgi:hypothetical protein